MPDAVLRISHMAYPVTSLGPGSRVALWVSGCRLRCRGCITPGLLDPASGKPVGVAQVADRLLSLSTPVSGITLTGGEPFDQASALAELLDEIAPARPDWSVLAFSGYPLKSMRSHASRALLANLDILIAGPYVDTLPRVHPLAASANQTIHYLSERGRRLEAQCDRLPFDHANLGMGSDTGDWLIGIISPNARSRLHRGLRLNELPAEHPVASHDG